MRHEADMIDGPTEYLGHFRQRKFLTQGHNTDDEGYPSDLGHVAIVPMSSQAGRPVYTSNDTIGGVIKPDYDFAVKMQNMKPANDR